MIAVEPLTEMRRILAETAPGAELVEARAEEMPFEAAEIDAVTVAQAFHWFQAERALSEIARILRPEGSLGLVWNVRDLSDPLQRQIDELLRPHRGAAPSEHERPWREAIANSPAFGPESLRSFPWIAHYDASALVDRIASVSFVAALDPGERERLLGELRALVAQLPEPFPFLYHTDVYVYRRTPEPVEGVNRA